MALESVQSLRSIEVGLPTAHPIIKVHIFRNRGHALGPNQPLPTNSGVDSAEKILLEDKERLNRPGLTPSVSLMAKYW